MAPSEDAKRSIERLFGQERYELGRQGRVGELMSLFEEPLFGQVYNRDGLDIVSRCLCNVAVMTALGREAQLATHVRNALRVGADKNAIVEVIYQTAFYAGLPYAVSALRAIEPILDESE